MSGKNIIAAILSFFIPGLGQLIQGRFIRAIVMLVLAGVMWFFLLGWLIHLWSVIDAAMYKRN
jgi:TM2 domain-containing membrane protein YozV